jgi:hypothetical protein
MTWSATAGRLTAIDKVAARPRHSVAEAAAARRQAALCLCAISTCRVHDEKTGRTVGDGAPLRDLATECAIEAGLRRGFGVRKKPRAISCRPRPVAMAASCAMAG